MTQHTPAPWTVNGTPGTSRMHPELLIESEYGQVASVLAENCDSDEQAIADACLISASPDLLEALRPLLEIVEAELENDPEPHDLGSWHRAIAQARFAIAKANGEPLPREIPPAAADLCDQCRMSGVEIARTNEAGETICVDCDAHCE